MSWDRKVLYVFEMNVHLLFFLVSESWHNIVWPQHGVLQRNCSYSSKFGNATLFRYPRDYSLYLTFQKSSLLLQLLEHNVDFAICGVQTLNLKATGRVSNNIHHEKQFLSTYSFTFVSGRRRHFQYTLFPDLLAKAIHLSG